MTADGSYEWGCIAVTIGDGANDASVSKYVDSGTVTGLGLLVMCVAV